MILRTAVRELRAHPGRTAFAIAGVAVASAMLLDMLMLAGGLQSSFRGLLSGAGFELRVSPAGTLPLDTDATLLDAIALADDIRNEPGVAAVSPVLALNIRLEGTSTPTADAGDPIVFALGVDPDAQGLYRIVDGRDLEAPSEVLVDERSTSGVGDTLRLTSVRTFGSAAAASAELIVVGTAEFLYSSASDVPVALDIEALRELASRPAEASFFMLDAEPGTDPDDLAQRLRARIPTVEIVSIREIVRRAEQRLSYFQQLAFILGSVSLVVTALLVGTIMAVSINDRYGIIAALRAIGVSRRSIVVTLLVETLALVTVAGGIGLVLGSLTARYLERILSDFPGLPAAIRFFVLEPRQLWLAIAALVAVGVAAALIPAYRASTLPIATTLHREEP
ncbi:MAG: ABC transporter permease [marine benthic group bacterium]|nr:ABC transporter permease [Gemmatimonadota bacterium]